MADLAKLVDDLSSLTVLEAADLAKDARGEVGRLRRRGRRRGRPCRRRRRSGRGDRPSSTSCLSAAGDKKIEVIKEVRAITGLGLKEGQGPGRGRAQDRQGGRVQGRGRQAQGAAREGRRQGRPQVTGTGRLQRIGLEDEADGPGKPRGRRFRPAERGVLATPQCGRFSRDDATHFRRHRAVPALRKGMTPLPTCLFSSGAPPGPSDG